jgi:predicted membrane chloride channel (bestrophin family)
MMQRRAQQGGLSMLGFLFVAVVVVVCVMIGFRVTPAYIEYYSVQKALAQALVDAKDLNSTAEVRAAFQKRVDAGYIESVSARDLEVVKTRNDITASASWTRKLPLVANASLLLEFEATATR